jgi:hypothetical protein
MWAPLEGVPQAHLVQVGPPVLPVQDVARLPVTAEQLEVDVLDDDRLDVRRALGRHRVAAERDVRRREDARLRVLHVHVVDVGQVAHVARERDEHVVLDAARLRAVPHAQVPVPLVGAEGHEEDLGPLLGRQPAQLRELDVVADLDRHLALVGLEHLELVARARRPTTAARSA